MFCQVNAMQETRPRKKTRERNATLGKMAAYSDSSRGARVANGIGGAVIVEPLAGGQTSLSSAQQHIKYDIDPRYDPDPDPDFEAKAAAISLRAQRKRKPKPAFVVPRDQPRPSEEHKFPARVPEQSRTRVQQENESIDTALENYQVCTRRSALAESASAERETKLMAQLAAARQRSTLRNVPDRVFEPARRVMQGVKDDFYVVMFDLAYRRMMQLLMQKTPQALDFCHQVSQLLALPETETLQLRQTLDRYALDGDTALMARRLRELISYAPLSVDTADARKALTAYDTLVRGLATAAAQQQQQTLTD